MNNNHDGAAEIDEAAESHCEALLCCLPLGHSGVHRSEDGVCAWSDEAHYGWSEADFE